MLRARWQADAEDRDRTTQRLREELLELKENQGTSTTSGPQAEERIEKEVSRRFEEAKHKLEKEHSVVKQELLLRDQALAELRIQFRSAQEEARQTRGISQEDRQQAELALVDLQAQVSTKEEEIAQLREANSELQDELDETVVKFEDASIDRDRLIRLLETKEAELAQQQDQCDTAISAMRDLEEAVVRFESEAALKETQLGKLKKELELQTSVLEKREGVLAESERHVSKLRKERGILEAEKDKAVAFAEKLKRDSADRESEFLTCSSVSLRPELTFFPRLSE
jgi:chromosome segregation ATPase